MSVRRLRGISWTGVVLALGLIALLTWTPAATTGSGCRFGIPCGVGHALAFAVLGAPMAGVFATSRLARLSPRRALVTSFLALWLVAAIDELVQPSVGRDATLQDWAFDMVGGITGFLAGSVALRATAGRLGWSSPPERSVDEARATAGGADAGRGGGRRGARRRRRR